MRRKRKLSNRVITIRLILVLLVGLSALLYPTLANQWNSRTQSRAAASCDEAVTAMNEADYTEYFAEADACNAEIARICSETTLVRPEAVSGCEETPDITGTGIMGYVTNEKINVQLPICHGTSSSVLSAEDGHLEGSFLPVGGESTHSAISAHRGLPSSKFFTDLDQSEEGDTITVLDEVLTYEVDQISIVLPSEYENLYIETGEDYCTLMTRAPYAPPAGAGTSCRDGGGPTHLRNRGSLWRVSNAGRPKTGFRNREPVRRLSAVFLARTAFIRPRTGIRSLQAGAPCCKAPKLAAPRMCAGGPGHATFA